MRSGKKRPSENKTSVRAARRIAASILGEPLAAAPAAAGAARFGGRYSIRREIAHGGMGTVLEAWDNTIGRPVALKVIRLGADVAPEVRERFVFEAEVTARLEHPHIVPVHDLGREGDQAFFCMKLIEGEDLATLLKRHEAGRVRLLGIFQDICMAIAFAHDRGVIHRDLKPQNVMIGKFGETLLVDWGLAKAPGLGSAAERTRTARARAVKEGETTFTLDGQVLGTPGYMAPEQAEGRTVTERSDVWSLGAILRDVLGKDPPRELGALAARAMERDPANRPAGARELHDAVQVWLERAEDLERRRALALHGVAEGVKASSSLPKLRASLARVSAQVKRLRGDGSVWRTAAERRALWALEDRERTMSNAAIDAFATADAAFTSALGVDPACEAARAGKARLHWERFAEAETDGDESRARLARRVLEAVDGGEYAERLKGDGSLTARAFRFACDCLTRDAGGERQHGAKCRREEIVAEAQLFEWKERDRRLVPVRAAFLGRTPTPRVRLPMGSYFVVLEAKGLAPTRLPVRIGRCEDASPEVTMFTRDEIGDGFIHVPAGPFIAGGDADATVPDRGTIDWPDVFVGKDAVTLAEYREFLNGIDPAEAAAHAPRHDVTLESWWKPGRDGLYPKRPPGGKLPTPIQQQPWNPRFPIMGIAWATAAAYAAWRAKRDRRAIRLPHDNDFEKAARGVDGRKFPWGDYYDPTFSNCRHAHKEGPRLLPVGAMPSDTSPYGVRDLAGNVATWCRNFASRSGGDWRAVRGGACMNTGEMLRSAYKFGIRPKIIRPYVGIRVVAIPVAGNK
ncbi:MAG: bifunctional serine/threonine-protein kinase/formylglycine-generating enzyme family protein [Planctomycetota bacterium]